MLGMGVLDADEWLARRGVPLSYSADDLDADRKTLGELFNVKR
jgi:predicted HTH domain antitoxin